MERDIAQSQSTLIKDDIMMGAGGRSRSEALKVWQEQKAREKRDAIRNTRKQIISNKIRSGLRQPNVNVPHFMQPTKSFLMRNAFEKLPLSTNAHQHKSVMHARDTNQVAKAKDSDRLKGSAFASRDSKFTFTKTLTGTSGDKLPNKERIISGSPKVKSKLPTADSNTKHVPKIVKKQASSLSKPTSTRVGQAENNPNVAQAKAKSLSKPLTKTASNKLKTSSTLSKQSIQSKGNSVTTKISLLPTTRIPTNSKTVAELRLSDAFTRIIDTEYSEPLNVSVPLAEISIHSAETSLSSTLINDISMIGTFAVPVTDTPNAENLPTNNPEESGQADIIDTVESRSASEDNIEDKPDEVEKQTDTGITSAASGRGERVIDEPDVQSVTESPTQIPDGSSLTESDLEHKLVESSLDIPAPIPPPEAMEVDGAPSVETIESVEHIECQSEADTEELKSTENLTSEACTTTEESAAESDVKGVEYFKQLVITNTDLLESLAAKWDTINEEIQVSDDIHGDVRTVSCQARLVIAQRFEQFSELIYNCEFNVVKEGEGPTLCRDLDGFWTMVYFQVQDILSKFNKLDDLMSNNWIAPVEELPKLVKAAASKETKAKKSVSKKPTGRSKFAEFRANMAARKNEKETIPEQAVMSIRNVEILTDKDVTIFSPKRDPTTPAKPGGSIRRSTRKAAMIANAALLSHTSQSVGSPTLRTLADLQTSVAPLAPLVLSPERSTPVSQIRKSARKAQKTNLSSVSEPQESNKENVGQEAKLPGSVRKSGTKLFSYSGAILDRMPSEGVFSPMLTDTVTTVPTILEHNASPSLHFSPAKVNDLSAYLAASSPATRRSSRRVSFVRLQKSCSPSPALMNAMMRASIHGKRKTLEHSESLHKKLMSLRAQQSSNYSPSTLFEGLQLDSPARPRATKDSVLSVPVTDDLVIFTPPVTPGNANQNPITPRKSARISNRKVSLL